MPNEPEHKPHHENSTPPPTPITTPTQVTTPVVEATQAPQGYVQNPSMPAAQPGAPVQYVVMQQSLQGIGGWLIFWMIVFSIAAIGYIWLFFTAMLMSADIATGLKVVYLIFSPILAGGFIASVVLMAMQKKLAKLVTLITLGVSAVYSVIASLVGYLTANSAINSYCDSSYYYSSSYSNACSTFTETALPMVIGGILVSVVIHGLVALYFFMSKRVKQALVK